MSYASEYRVGFGAELDVSKLFVHVDDTENFDESSFAPVATLSCRRLLIPQSPALP